MAQQYMIVNLADGKSVIYNVEDVENVTFRTVDEPQVPETDWVDLGLPSGLLWASCNLGADAVEGAGNYYLWGDVKPFEFGSAENKNYQGVSEGTLQSEGVIDADGILTPSHDPVTVAYGDGYRTPDVWDLGELKDNCSWEWEEINGVKCVRFTSKVNGKSIVIPGVGVINGDNGTIEQYNELAAFWTSVASGSLCYDFYMTIPEKDGYGYNSGNFINLTSFRKHAHCVRAVREKNAAPQAWQPTSVLGTCKLGDKLDVRGWVTAIDARGFILSDLSGSVLCYQASGFDVNNVSIGDQITVSSEITQYNTGLQIAISDGSYTVGANDAYEYPEAKTYTGAMMDEAVTRTDNCLAEYVKFVGTCAINGNYVNFVVDGAATAQASGYQVPPSVKDQLVDGESYEICGYFVSVSSSRYFNVVITDRKSVV